MSIIIKNGSIEEVTITDENEQAYFGQIDGTTFTIYKDTLEDTLSNGDKIEGMIYEDMNGNNILQTDLPNIRPGYYGWGTVVLVRSDLGVFVDIGLRDKEIVVSLDDLPDERDLWPRKGNKLYLTFEIDQKNRIWGKLANQEETKKIMKKAPDRLMNQDINVTIYQPILAGSLAISEEGYEVFIHESEQFHSPRLGETIRGRVVVVHEDGSLNVSLRPRAHEAIEGDAKMIYVLLSQIPTHYLALHDKSDPEDIKNQLGMSKGQFKRAVGQLMKERIVKQVKNDGIYLIEEAKE